MSKIIEFLEKMGQDADLRYAASAELEDALKRADVDHSAREAILQQDQQRLETLLDARANVCCMIARPLKEDEGDEDDEAEEEVKDDKTRGVKSHDPPARCAA